jgi:hypothetical protein
MKSPTSTQIDPLGRKRSRGCRKCMHFTEDLSETLDPQDLPTTCESRCTSKKHLDTNFANKIKVIHIYIYNTRSRSGNRVNRQESAEWLLAQNAQPLHSLVCYFQRETLKAPQKIHLQNSKITFSSQTYQPTLVQHLVPFVVFVSDESSRATSTLRQART